MFELRYKELSSAPVSSPLRFIFAACKGYRRFFVSEVFYGFFNSLFKILVPVIFSAMIEYFSHISPAEFSWRRALMYLGGILGVFLLINGLRFFREMANESWRNMIAWRVQEYALTYAAGHSAAYLKEQKSGQLAQRIFALSTSCYRQMLSFSRISSCFWLIVLTLFFIGRASLWFLVPIMGFGLLSVLLSIKISRRTTELNKTSAEEQAKFGGEVVDALSNILLIKMFGQERQENAKLQKDMECANNAEIYAVKSQLILNGLQAGVIMMFKICGIFLALYLWKNGVVSVADVVLVLLLLEDVLKYFERFLYDVTFLRTNLGKLDDSLKFLRVPHEIINAPNAQPLKLRKGKIEFRDVSFGYTAQKKIFNRFSLTIEPGEKIGIVGRSGSGKSTLINLLQRNYDISDGEILIDGQNISQVTLHSLRQALAVMAQDSQLFHRTIRKNIAFGSLEASERQIYAAAKKAYADGFIKETAHGYLTITGERGVKLSGGQRQRIAVARTLLKKAPILILDEATSALDNETENEVMAAISELMKNRTVIAIAHRLSTLKEMDRIIVLDKGKIVEEGTPQTLLDKQGKFAKLWRLQQA